jgi:hypothetical protein
MTGEMECKALNGCELYAGELIDGPLAGTQCRLFMAGPDYGLVVLLETDR